MNIPVKTRKWQLIVIVLMVVFTMLFHGNKVNAYNQGFINRVSRPAIEMGKRTGRFPSVAIAQMIDESAWGQSRLAKTKNNILGIKNGDGSYASFSSFEESIAYYGELFIRSAGIRRHYARFLAATTPNEAAMALSGTYAENTDYGYKLIRLMERYDLYRFDTIMQEEIVVEEAARQEAIRLEQERIEKERQAELRRLEKIRLELLKTPSLKHEEAYKRLVLEYAVKYDLFMKLDIENIEFDGILHKLKLNERSILEKGE